MDPEQLEQLGFSANEARIYLVLVQSGPLSAGTISKKCQINRRTTYDTITRLLEKGYLSYSIAANRKMFKAASPDIILEKIQEMQQSARETVQALKSIANSQREKGGIDMYEGRKGVRSILNDILKEKKYVVFGSLYFPDVLKHDFIQFQKKKEQLRIKSRIILSSKARGHPMLKESYLTCRFIPEEFSSPISTFVFGNKIAIIILSDVLAGMVIENKDVSRSFRQYFETLWKIGKN